MNNQNLIQLIRESIQNYISEIDFAGENAACEAKINAIGDVINTREKKMKMEGIDEAYHDMLDKDKMKELASEVKVLKKSLAKYEKQLEKLKSKGNSKIEKVKDTEKEEIIDETSLNEGVTDFPFASKEDIEDAWGEIYDTIVDNMSELEKFKITEPTNSSDPVKGYKFDFPDRGVPKIEKKASDVFLTKYGISYMDALNSIDNIMDKNEEIDYWNDGDIDPAGGYGPRSHMEEDMNIYEVLHMQKLAGIITEEQYNEATQNPTPKKSNSSTVGGVTVSEKDLNVDAIMAMIKTKASNIKNIDTVPELVKLFDALLTYIEEITNNEASKAEMITSLDALIRKHKTKTFDF